MKLFDLTSGFIAAALILLGNFQNVEKPQVQDKPLVVETKVLQMGTFVFQGGADWTDPEAYRYSPTHPGCEDGTELCAIQAEIDDPNALDADKRPVINGTLKTNLEDLQETSPSLRTPTAEVFLKD